MDKQEQSNYFTYVYVEFSAHHVYMSEEFWLPEVFFCVYFKYPDSYNTIKINKDIKRRYNDWIKEEYKYILPSVELNDTKKMAQMFGTPDENVYWEIVSEEEWMNLGADVEKVVVEK